MLKQYSKKKKKKKNSSYNNIMFPKHFDGLIYLARAPPLLWREISVDHDRHRVEPQRNETDELDHWQWSTCEVDGIEST